MKANIMEIGCGMGHNLYSLRKLGYGRVTGFDISRECVEYCRDHQFQAVWSANIQNLTKKSKFRSAFDLVIVYDLLEHLSPAEGVPFLQSLRPLLKGNGRLLLSVPNGEFPLNLPMRYVDVSHKLLYTHTSLAQLLHLSGMKDVSFISVPAVTLYDDSLVRRLFKHLIMYPVSMISMFLMRVYLKSLGISLKYPYPQLVCLAQVT